MKKNFRFKFVLSLAIALASYSAMAQSQEQQEQQNQLPLRLSIGAEAGLPLGNLKDGYDWSSGATLQLDYAIKDDLYIIATTGFTNFYAKKNAFEDLQLIPAKLGIKYFIVDNFYVQAAAGVSFLVNKEDTGYTKSATFAYSPQVGYVLPLGKSFIDAGLRFEANSKFTEASDSTYFLGLRVAYGLNL